MAFRISRGLWQFAKADGTYETKYKINTSGQIVQTDNAGNEVAGLAASSVAWTAVTGKPTTFSPSAHTHDDRYYTESESDNRFVRKDTTGQYLKPYNEYTSNLPASSVASSIVSQMGGGGLRVDFLSNPSFGSWAHAISFSGYNGYNMYQLAGHYKGSGGLGPDLYVRCEPNHAQNSWSSWEKLWHTGNDGSGSGLDADLLDGNHASAFALSSHTHSNATTSVAGFMSTTDKTKLDGIATNANNYVHPTTAGNKHIPAGGSAGQFLKYSADGTAVWAADNNTTYSVGDNGLTEKNFTSALKTKLDGIAASANNYSLPLSTASVRGGVKIGYTANGKNYPVQLSSEQMYVNVPWTDTDTNTTYSAGTGLTLSGTTFSVTGGTYAAASHTHDDRYYTESESDSRFAGLNNSSYFLDGGGTTSGYFEGNIPGITSYYDGLTINMFARNAFASYNYVNINGLGNAQVFLYNTSRLTTHYPRYSTIKLVYKSDWNGGCWFTEMYYFDTGDYRIRWQNNITFGAYTHGYQLLLEGVDGKYYPVTEGGSTGNTNTVSTAQIRVGGNILYYDTSTDQAANSNQGDYDLYQGYYTGNMEYWNNVDAGWATPYAPVYLVGTIEPGNYFKLDNSSYTSFLTQNLPSTDDGKVYWYIGIMNNNYDAFRLDINHPMYHYKDGAVRIYVPEHTHSIADVSGLQTALNGKQASGSYLTTSGKAADSNLLDGLDLHTGRNNEANKVVRTDANGYIQAGWINTPSGATTSTLTKIYASQDDYVRYVTPTEFRRQITDGVYQPVGSYQPAGSYAASSHSHSWSEITSKPSTFSPSTHALSSHTNDANYNIFSGWLRENGDNDTFRVYGNSRMVVFRTDGTAGDTGHTGYAFKWTYGGDATGNTRMLLNNSGGIWTPLYGWLDSAFQAAGSAINTGNIGSQSVNYATSSDSANHAGKIRSNTFWGGVTNFNNFREQARIKYWEILGANKTSTAYPATPDQAAISAGGNNYGSLFTASGDYAHFEMYFPNNTGNIIHPEYTPYFRTGYQGSWSDWSRFVTSTGETTTILNGTTCILKTEGTAQWGSPSTAVVEIKAQSDNWAIKSYRWATKAPNFNGSAFRLERYSQDAGWNLLGEVPINSTNWEWQGEITWGMSDSRVKTNIVTMEDGLSTINKVRPVTFDWSPVEGVSDREGADFGFIAQELEEIIPGAVHTRTDGYKTVRYEKVVPVLVQAIKEQQSLIDSLVARIEALENK